MINFHAGMLIDKFTKMVVIDYFASHSCELNSVGLMKHLTLLALRTFLKLLLLLLNIQLSLRCLSLSLGRQL